MSDQNDAIVDLAKGLISAIRQKGKKEIGRMAQDGRKQLELRSLKKDRHKMYEKIGREVERLIEAGDIEHPGLIRGIERIHQLDERIAALSKKELPIKESQK